MKAVIMTGTGGPEMLRHVERPDPVPGPGEALVEIADSERALQALRREAVTTGTLTATRDLRTRIAVLERQISGLEFWEPAQT